MGGNHHWSSVLSKQQFSASLLSQVPDLLFRNTILPMISKTSIVSMIMSNGDAMLLGMSLKDSLGF
eukprot:scaffold29281_cov64-Attheya_sp.AAC.2